MDEELVLVLNGVFFLRASEYRTKPLFLVTVDPVVEIGGEVNEGLEAEFLEEIGVVDGEGVVYGDSAPFRSLVLQTLHRWMRMERSECSSVFIYRKVVGGGVGVD